MAFQIIDDILDYIGTDEEIGKKSGNDLKDGIYTLPLLLALKNNKEVFENLLDKEFYSNEEVNKIINLVKENDGISESIILAEKYSNKAFKNIDKLPENEYKYILKEVTEKLLKRSY